MFQLPADRLLAGLLIAAFGFGGYLIGYNQAVQEASYGSGDALRAELETALSDVDFLREENTKLQTIIEGGEQIEIPFVLKQEVEKFYGLLFKSEPLVDQTTALDLWGRVRAANEIRMGAHGLLDLASVYQLLGAIEDEEQLASSVVTLEIANRSAWFDYLSNTGHVTERFSIEDFTDQAELLRVLAKVLLCQHFDVFPEGLSNDGFLTRSAILEALTEPLIAKFYARQSLENGFLPLERQNHDLILESGMPQFFKKRAVWLKEQANRWASEVVDLASEVRDEYFANLPKSSYELLQKNGEMPLSKFSQVRPSEVFLEGSLGLASVQSLAPQLNELGLVFDHFILFPDGEDSIGLILDLEFQTQEPEWLEKQLVPKLRQKNREVRFHVIGKNNARILNVALPATAEKYRQSAR